jgi:hypothetical protein
MLPAGRQTLYFFPDRLLVYDGSGVGSVPYPALVATAGTTHFREDGDVPSDSQTVGTSWRFVNRDGGPDRRFNNNRQIPIVEYGQLSLRSESGLNEAFQCSRPETVAALVASIHSIANAETGVHDAPASPPLPSQSHLSEADDSPAGVQALTDRITAGFTALSEVLQSLETSAVQQQMYPLAKQAYAKVPTPYTRYYRGIIAAKLGHFVEAEKDLLAAYRDRAEPHKWLKERVEHLVHLGKLLIPA